MHVLAMTFLGKESCIVSFLFAIRMCPRMTNERVLETQTNSLKPSVKHIHADDFPIRRDM